MSSEYRNFKRVKKKLVGKMREERPRIGRIRVTKAKEDQILWKAQFL